MREPRTKMQRTGEEQALNELIRELRVMRGMALLSKDATDEEQSTLQHILESPFKDEAEFKDILLGLKGNIFQSVHITRVLLDMGATINGAISPRECPLAYAMKMCNLEMFLLLVGRGADVNFKATYGRRPLDIALYHYLPPSVHSVYTQMTRVLLRHGAKRGTGDEYPDPVRLSLYQSIEALVILCHHNLFFTDGVRTLRDFLL